MLKVEREVNSFLASDIYFKKTNFTGSSTSRKPLKSGTVTIPIAIGMREELAPFPPRQKLQFFSPSLLFFLNRNHTADTDKATSKDSETLDRPYLYATDDRTPAGNTGLAKVAVQFFVGQFFVNLNFGAS
jgi:hypothetical protein